MRGILPLTIFMAVNVFAHFVQAQSVGIATTAITPDASSILEVQSTTKGVLVPRVALTSTNLAGPVASPATSLLVYNTATAGAGATAVTPGYYYNAGTPAAPNWVRFMNSGRAWETIGNYGTSPATNWLGTNDAQDLAIRTNNTERMRILSGGNVGIGTTAPSQNLHVVGNSLVSQIMYVNSTVGGVIHYGNTGLFGQAVGFNPDGANSGVWIEGSNGEGGGFFANGNNAVIWSPGDNDLLRVFDEDVLPAGNPSFVINSIGNVGIASVTPTERLDVTGNVRFSGALMPNNDPGTSGKVLKSNGAGLPPSWISAVTPDNIYTVESTSQLAITTTTFTVIPGETITINGLNAGDRVLVWFGGNMYMDGSDYNDVDVALYINGTMAVVGGFVRVSLDNDYGMITWQNYSAVARYNVTAAGNYTFDVRARRLLSGNTIYIGGNSTQASEGVLMVFVLRG